MQRIIVVDTRLLAYNLYHRKQSQTEFLGYVYSLIGDLKYSKIIWAFDGKKGSVRRKTMYPEYKAQRKVTQNKQTKAEQERLKEFNKTYTKMAEYLKIFGTVINLDNEEADAWADIITQRYAGDTNFEITLLSSDGDWQMGLLSNNIKMFHVSKLQWITKNNIYEVSGKYKTVEDVATYQFICGMPKENVLGVKGLGIKRYYLAKESSLGLFPQIEEWIKTGKYGMKLPEKYSSLQEMYDFNEKLLRPVTLNDLSDEDRATFINQFNADKVILSETDRLILEEEVFGEIVYLPEELRTFYRI